ncbi:hypothetical protein J1614_008952 [Plenodomus biglobosus]|nr:hypothetical protein J1614_008952 [Plenodomus biglobosus]
MKATQSSIAAPPHPAQHVAVVMRAIWLRARWTLGSCRCISCISRPTRHPARGTSTSLRLTRARGCSTPPALYTTISAPGETTDAAARQAKNRRCEQALAPLSDAFDSQAARERALYAEQDAISHDELPGGLDWDTIQHVAGMDLIDDHVLRRKEVQSHDAATSAWDDLRYDSRTPGAPPLEWPANTGPELVRHNLPPQSLWAPDAMRMTAMRRRHTWKKMALQELSTGLLIHSLLGQANIARFSKALLHSDIVISQHLADIASMTEAQVREARRAILQHLEAIHSTDVKSSSEEIARVTTPIGQPAIPRYTQDPDGDFHAICQQMNRSIKQLLEQVPKGNDRAEAIAVTKICHNLLVSTAPPDLQTFNILMLGFKRMRRPRMVDSCIAAFHTQKIRPNEMTCREIMDHYAYERRPDDFSRFVAKMRGVGDALTLANPIITINQASHDRLARISENKVYQKIHPTPMVFGSLIGGVLKFAGFDRALDIYYEMKADGWGLDVQGLIRLLGDCVRRGDWEGGIYVWEEINSIKNDASMKDLTRAYYHMLSLCSITGNTVAFNQILNEIAQRGLDRKGIIAAATKQTRRMQKKSEYLAPAWAADNVLIAVSDYLNDAKARADDEGTLQDTDLDGTQAGQSSAQGQHGQKGPKDLWASWVEAEFGEKPKEPEL